MHKIKVYKEYKNRDHGDEYTLQVEPEDSRRSIIKKTKKMLGLTGVVCNQEYFDTAVVIKPLASGTRIIIDLNEVKGRIAL